MQGTMKCEPMKYRKVADLHPLPNNPRTIDKDGLARVVDSIKLNGFWEHRPMAIEEQDGRLVVLDGNQRLKAVKKLKIKEVPTVLYSDLTDDELGNSLMEWYYNKYKEQEANA